MAKLSVQIPMRWSDLDAYGHVNNAKMFTLLEEARIAIFWSSNKRTEGERDELHQAARILGGGATSGTHMLVAGQRIEYMRPLQWTGQDISVDMWLSDIGRASVEVCYEVFDATGQAVAKAATSVVVVDTETGRPRSIPEEDRERLTVLLDDPVVFRR